MHRFSILPTLLVHQPNIVFKAAKICIIFTHLLIIKSATNKDKPEFSLETELAIFIIDSALIIRTPLRIIWTDHLYIIHKYA